MSTDIRDGEFTPLDVTGQVEWLQRIATDAEAAATLLIDGGQWQTLCPLNPSHCMGETQAILVNGMPMTVECPLAEEIACPHYETREAARGAAEEAAVIERLVEIGFGPRYHHPEHERIPKHLRRACDEWLEGYDEHVVGGTALLLCGNYGCGKTSALAWIARKLLERADPPEMHYVLAPWLFDRIVASSEQVPVYAEPSVLMIDDIGLAHDANWPLARFITLMEMRYAWHRPTIITSSSDLTQLRDDNLWVPILDRLAERCVAVWEDAPSQRGGKR